MSEPQTPPPDPAIEALDDVCRRLAGFDERIDTEWVDGYLTALAASWRSIEIGQALPAMCGDAFERTFSDPEDVSRATQALAARLQQLRHDLDPEALLDDPDRLCIGPLMQVWDEAARGELVEQGLASAEDAAALQTGAVWAEGFFAALDDFSQDWPDPEGDGEMAQAYAALLKTVAALAWDPSSEDFRAFAREGWKDADPTRDELIDEACFAVQDLRVYWLDHAPRQAPRRVGATPGRNDPCFCGSGRKYKKCHGG